MEGVLHRRFHKEKRGKLRREERGTVDVYIEFNTPTVKEKGRSAEEDSGWWTRTRTAKSLFRLRLIA